MQESYNSDGNMTYQNLTPWIDAAFEEFNKGVAETGSNPEITKYWQYTQMPAAANNGDKYAQWVLTTDKESWCAAFANWTLETSGINGAIAVMNYSHVGYVVGQNSNGSLILLGGNQPGNSVNLNPTKQSLIFTIKVSCRLYTNFTFSSNNECSTWLNDLWQYSLIY